LQKENQTNSGGVLPHRPVLATCIAKASVDAPKGVVEEVIFPEVPEKWLQALIKEVEAGAGYSGLLGIRTLMPLPTPACHLWHLKRGPQEDVCYRLPLPIMHHVEGLCFAGLIRMKLAYSQQVYGKPLIRYLRIPLYSDMVFRILLCTEKAKICNSNQWCRKTDVFRCYWRFIEIYVDMNRNSEYIVISQCNLK
jgi:hypothetical protein